MAVAPARCRRHRGATNLDASPLLQPALSFKLLADGVRLVGIADVHDSDHVAQRVDPLERAVMQPVQQLVALPFTVPAQRPRLATLVRAVAGRFRRVTEPG